VWACQKSRSPQKKLHDMAWGSREKDQCLLLLPWFGGPIFPATPNEAEKEGGKGEKEKDDGWV